MLAHSRSAFLAGLLATALVAPAWSADGEVPKAAAIGTEQPVDMAVSPAGPLVARESLGTDASAQTAIVGESQPTRGYNGPSVGRRYAGTRAGTTYRRPVHRYSLMLGIGY